MDEYVSITFEEKVSPEEQQRPRQWRGDASTMRVWRSNEDAESEQQVCYIYLQYALRGCHQKFRAWG